MSYHVSSGYNVIDMTITYVLGDDQWDVIEGLLSSAFEELHAKKDDPDDDHE